MSSHEHACARRTRGVAQDRNKVQGVRPADGHNGCHIKERISEDLGMSPRQLPQNTACGGGVLVTLITPSSGRLARRSSKPNRGPKNLGRIWPVSRNQE